MHPCAALQGCFFVAVCLGPTPGASARIEDAQYAALRVEMGDLDAAGLADSQTTVINEREDGAEAGDAHAGEQGAHFGAGQNAGQRRGAFDFDLVPASPVVALQVVAVKGAQGADALVEGAALVALDLLDVKKEGEDLFLPQQRSAGDVVMLGDASDPGEVSLQGAGAQAFEVEETGETG